MMNSHIAETWEPYFDDEEAKSIIGKCLLVGITYRNHSDEITGQEQFYGKIIRASLKEGIIIRSTDNNEERWIPPDLSRLKQASPGEYRLKSTGEVVINPDFLSTWTVYPPRR